MISGLSGTVSISDNVDWELALLGCATANWGVPMEVPRGVPRGGLLSGLASVW